MNKKFLPILVLTLSTFLTICFVTPSFACSFNICKFDDLNGNGVQDPGEPNIPGWLIRIYNDLALPPLAEQLTDESGCVYIYLSTAGPTYKVWEEQRECWEATAPEAMLIGNGGYYVEVPTYSGSEHFIDFGNMYVCNGGGEGCTPGFWRNPKKFDLWPIDPSTLFFDVFGVGPSDPMKDTIQLGGGGQKALIRHGTAAYLNAVSLAVDYFYSPDEVIAIVQEAYATGDFTGAKDTLEAENDPTDCPLSS
jgi:hypothetical protein